MGGGYTYYNSIDGYEIIVTGNPSGGLYDGCALRYRYPFNVTNMTVALSMITFDTAPKYGTHGVVLANYGIGQYYIIGLKIIERDGSLIFTSKLVQL